MNEITRIHLAKVAYDIDIAAKKYLEKYIKELEEFTGSGEVLNDIEIRMTELLAERHVKAGGVIAKDDVEAIRKQLGEPYEFAEEDSDITIDQAVGVHQHPRKFFRDTHNAVLGGVLSGIALYAKVDVLWVRLGFALILFGSFGFAFFGYILAWIIVPAAKTATDRLRQTGKPVTASSIRSLKNDTAAMTPSTVAPVVRRVISVAIGIVCYVGALGIVTLMLVGFLAFLRGGQRIFTEYAPSHSMSATNWAFGGVAALGLLLLVVLLCIVAYSFVTQKLTKRLVVSGIIIVALGLVCSIALAGIVTLGSWQTNNEIQQLTKPRNVTLPSNFNGVNSVAFIIDTKDGHLTSPTPAVHYIVESSGTPRYTFRALPGTKINVSVDGASASLTVVLPSDSRSSFFQPDITIYGPALEAISSKGMSVDYRSDSQKGSLTVIGDSDSNISLIGSADSVKVIGSGMVDLSSASIVDLAVTGSNGLNVTAGTVRSLDVTLPDVCPTNSGNSMARVAVSGVTSGTFTYNGNKRSVASYQTSCAQVAIDSSQDNSK